MPRHKIYDTCEMPRTVVHIAKAICADYERRARALRAGIEDNTLRAAYERMNAWVDAALSEIEEPAIRAMLLRDMIARRGYQRSAAQTVICENSYYARRRKVLYLVARAASLIV